MLKHASFRRSFGEFKRHPWLHFVSIATISVALFILGGVFLCLRNVESLADKTSPEITGTITLRDGLAASDTQSVQDRIKSEEGVEKLEFKSRHTVVKELQSFLGEASTGSFSTGELFPDVIELTLRKEFPTESVAQLSEKIETFPEVLEVDFSEDWLVQYKKVRGFLTGASIVLLLAVLIGCSFIIANFMGMRHQSRKEEIEIIRFMGAKSSYVLIPFLVEALLEGLVGSTIALFFLFIAKTMMGAALQLHWGSFLGIKQWLFLSPAQMMLVVLVGIAMATLGGLSVFFRFRGVGSR